MAYENVRIPTSYPNFCIAPRSNNEFGYINHSSDVFRIIRTSDGAVQQTYTLSSGVSEIKSLEYVGPRNLGGTFDQLGDELPFFTLEHVSSTQCQIKRWKLNNTANTFDWQSTITLTTGGTDYFDSYAMVVENYETSFNTATTTGTGQIQLASIGSVEIGDSLLLGPSGDTDNLNAFEYVTVTGVAGNWVYLDSSEPLYEYAGTDPITYWKNIYLFSDIGRNNDTTKGSLYTIDPDTGTVTSGNSNGMYNGVIAASWSRQHSYPAFVKNNNILYIDPTDYEIKKSHVMNNIDSGQTTILPVYDIVFDDVDIYRLQADTIRFNDSGSPSMGSWSTYNYQKDQITPYTKSIVLWADPDGIVLNDDQVTIYATVRDQFGAGLSGKTVTFYDTPDEGAFGNPPPDNTEITDANGDVSILYETLYYNPTDNITNESIDTKNIAITVKTDGAVAGVNGSTWVWDGIELLFHTRFRDYVYMDAVISGMENFTLLDQIEDVSISAYMTALSRFQFPGGHWTGTNPSSDGATVIEQLLEFESDIVFEQIDKEMFTDVYLDQDKEHSNDLQLSQLYISRHNLTGHKDTADIEQFRFIEEAIPAFWSEKNAVSTNIWIKLRPLSGFSLNLSTLIFKVREASYTGDTGYVDVTSSCAVSTWDAGGGNLGLEILYNPPVNFHHNSTVYVSIEVYDNAGTPNIILTDYWFKVIPDFRPPYIENEDPDREEEDVSVGTNVSFDIYDAGVGVDISTLELYMNNRRVVPITTTISGGYHVEYNPPTDFYYGQTVEVTVKAQDASDYSNQLYDTWRFYCVGSTGPWIDTDSFYPRNCTKGTYRKLTGISFNVYAVNDTGVDRDSILVTIGGKDRNVTITPIIYRID